MCVHTFELKCMEEQSGEGGLEVWADHILYTEVGPGCHSTSPPPCAVRIFRLKSVLLGQFQRASLLSSLPALQFSCPPLPSFVILPCGS